MKKNLKFTNYLNVDYTPGEPEQTKKNAHKRKRADVEESFTDNMISKKTLSQIMSLKTNKQLKQDHQDYVVNKGKGKKLLPHKLKHVQSAIGVEMKKRGSDLEEATRHTSFATWKGKVERMGWKMTKDNKKGVMHAWDGSRHKGSYSLTSGSGSLDEAKVGDKIIYDQDLKEVSDLGEALDAAQRRARARMMKKIKSRIKLGQQRAKRRMASKETLEKRARKHARKAIFGKLAKNQDKGEMTFQRRQEIEKRLDKMGPRIDRLARKMLPKVRKKELQRRQGKPSND